MHTKLFPVKLSSVIFINIPSITKLFFSFTGVFFVTLFACHKIVKRLIVTYYIYHILTLVSLSIVRRINLADTITNILWHILEV